MALQRLWERVSGTRLSLYNSTVQIPIIDGQSLALGWNGTPDERTALGYLNRRGVRALRGLQRSDGATTSIHGNGSLGYNAVQATGEFAAVPATNAPACFVFAEALDAWRKLLGLAQHRLLVGFNGLAGQPIAEFDRIPGGAFGTLIRDNHLRWMQEARRVIPDSAPLVYGMIQGEADVSFTRAQYYTAADRAYADALADITTVFGTTPPLMVWQTGGYVNTQAHEYGSTLAQLDLVRDRNGIMAGPNYPYHLSDAIHPYHIPSIIMFEVGAYVFAKREQGVNLSMLYGTPTVVGNTMTIPVQGIEPGKSLVFDPVNKYASYGGLADHGVQVSGTTVTSVVLQGSNIVITAGASISGRTVQIAMQSGDMGAFVDANGRNYGAHRCDIMESNPVDSLIAPGNPLKRYVLSGRWSA